MNGHDSKSNLLIFLNGTSLRKAKPQMVSIWYKKTWPPLPFLKKLRQLTSMEQTKNYRTRSPQMKIRWKWRLQLQRLNYGQHDKRQSWESSSHHPFNNLLTSPFIMTLKSLRTQNIFLIKRRPTITCSVSWNLFCLADQQFLSL